MVRRSTTKRRHALVGVILATVIVASSTEATAGPGDFDATYGNGGYASVTAAAPFQYGTAQEIAVSSDGRVLTVGTVCSPQCAAVVTRRTSDGSPDPSFGTGGSVPLDPSLAFRVIDMAVASTGEVYLSVVTNVSTKRVVKLSSSGGVVPFASPTVPYSDPRDSIAVRSDGTVLWAASGASGIEIPITLYELDPSGAVLRSTMLLRDDGARQLVALPDGDAVLVNYSGAWRIGVGDATVTDQPLPLPDGASLGAVAAVDDDGRIYVSVPRIRNQPDDGSVLARYVGDALDPTFGTGGVVQYAVGTAGTDSLAIDASDRALLARLDVTPTGSTQIEVHRVDASGAVDETYGPAGRRATVIDGPTFPLIRNGLLGAGIDGSGRLVAAFTAAHGVDTLGIVARLTVDGELDAGWDGDGVVFVGAPMVDTRIQGVWSGLVEPSGRTTALGTTMRAHLVLARFTPEGVPDASFGDGGVVVDDIGGAYASMDPPPIVLDVGGGSVVVVVRGLKIVRYDASGQRDVTFGGAPHGVVRRPDGASVIAASIDPQGRIVVVADSAVHRLLPSGAPDPSFGTGGTVEVASTVRKAAIDAQGRVYLAVEDPMSDPAYSLLRLVDGQPDPAWPATTYGHRFLGLGVDRQGRPVVAVFEGSLVQQCGPTCFFTLPGMTVRRYTAAGALDSSFGTAGSLVIFPNEGPITFDRTGLYLSGLRRRDDGSIDNNFGLAGGSCCGSIGSLSSSSPPMAAADDTLRYVGSASLHAAPSPIVVWKRQAPSNTPVDSTPPEVVITSPVSGASFTLGQSVDPAATCTDAGATIACDALPAVDTSTPGTKTYTVTALDAAGNVGTASVSYEVTNTFADANVTGSVTAADAGVTYSVVDAPAPDGVTITAAGTGRVTLSVCGGFTVRVYAGSTVTITCGSVTLKVASGPAEVVLGATVIGVPGGSTATVDLLPGGEPTVVVSQGTATVATGSNPPVSLTPGPRPTYLCNGRVATIVGTAGADRITGTAGPDVIVALGGDDRIEAGGGDDTICAGAGDDRIEAGSGADWVDGGSGEDRIEGGSGNDTLLGGAGDDRIEGGSGIDIVVGGVGSDRCSVTAASPRPQSCERS